MLYHLSRKYLYCAYSSSCFPSEGIFNRMGSQEGHQRELCFIRPSFIHNEPNGILQYQASLKSMRFTWYSTRRIQLCLCWHPCSCLPRLNGYIICISSLKNNGHGPRIISKQRECTFLSIRYVFKVSEKTKKEEVKAVIAISITYSTASSK